MIIEDWVMKGFWKLLTLRKLFAIDVAMFSKTEQSKYCDSLVHGVAGDYDEARKHLNQCCIPIFLTSTVFTKK